MIFGLVYNEIICCLIPICYVLHRLMREVFALLIVKGNLKRNLWLRITVGGVFLAGLFSLTEKGCCGDEGTS